MSSTHHTPLLVEPKSKQANTPQNQEEEEKYSKEDNKLKAFLNKASLPYLYDILQNKGIGYDQLKSLSTEDFDDDMFFDIKIGHKKKLKKAIECIQMEKVTVLVVGDPGVGKTSFIRRYTQNTFHENNNIDESMINYVEHVEQLSDGSLINIEIYDDSAIEDTPNADAIIICYDKNAKKSFENCVKWRQKIDPKSNVIVIVLACKSDQGYINRKDEEKKHKNILDGPGWNAFNAWSLECSAKNDTNIRNVFITTAEQKRIKKPTNFDDTMVIVVIGDSGVGKTCLIKRFVRNNYNDDSLSSFGVDSCIRCVTLHDGSIMRITIWDTAGQERYQSVCKNYYRKADVILFCYDMSYEKSLDSNGQWRTQIEEYGKDDVIVNLVGCKSDRVNNNRLNLSVQEIMNTNEWKKFDSQNVECSAKTGQNIQNVFLTAAEMVFERKKTDKITFQKSTELVPRVDHEKHKCCSSMGFTLR